MKAGLLLMTTILLLSFSCQKAVQAEKGTAVLTADSAKMIARMVIARSRQNHFYKISVERFNDANGKPNSYGKFLSERIIMILGLSGVLRVTNRSSSDVDLTGNIEPLGYFNLIKANLTDLRDNRVLGTIEAKESLELFNLKNDNPNDEGLETAGKTGSGDPFVEVMESSMRKVRDGIYPNYITIVVFGRARFSQGNRVGFPFKNYKNKVEVDLLDRNGRTVVSLKGELNCGENSNPGNVKHDVLFPFIIEDPLVRKDLLERIESFRIRKWSLIE